MIQGLDIAGIAGPLVSLAFGLGDGVTVTCTVVVGGSFRMDMKADKIVVTGGTPVSFKGIMYRDKNREQPDVTARTSTLMIDPAALKAACVAAGVGLPPLNNNDALAIQDSTGTKAWTIFEQNAIPGAVLLSYQVRR